jgi:hypothetical protein
VERRAGQWSVPFERARARHRGEKGEAGGPGVGSVSRGGRRRSGGGGAVPRGSARHEHSGSGPRGCDRCAVNRGGDAGRSG